MNKYKFLLFAAFCLILISCDSKPENSDKNFPNFNEVQEYKIKEILLEGEITERKSELSGLTWYKSDLIFLPQYPFLRNSKIGKLYKVNKKRIENYINGNDTNKISVEEISFFAEGLEKFNQIGSGYEAIAFNGNDVYITIESMIDDDTLGYLVKGVYEEKENKITLDSSTLRKIKPRADIYNYSEESVLIYNDNIYTLYEANGKNISKESSSYMFNSNLRVRRSIKFPFVEYRITDASNPDSSGKFWAINYFYTGEEKILNPSADLEIQKFGIGFSHNKNKHVERLLEFQILENEIIRTDKAPIQFELDSKNSGRNWEGLVKLDNKGFLVVSDYFPKTILGFVKYKNK